MDVSVYEYYLGEAQPMFEDVKREHEKIAMELLADAHEAGRLLVSAEYAEADFKIVYKLGAKIFLVMLGKQEVQVELPNPAIYIDESTSMFSAGTDLYLEHAQMEIDNFFS